MKLLMLFRPDASLRFRSKHFQPQVQLIPVTVLYLRSSQSLISRISQQRKFTDVFTETATGPYPQPNGSNAHPPTQILEDAFQYYSPINA
jgi:hypothetical protein